MLEGIRQYIERDPYDLTAWDDGLSVARASVKEDKDAVVAWVKWACERCGQVINEIVGKDLEKAQKLVNVHTELLLVAAPYDFDSFLLYVESGREPDKKFYVPRRKILKQVVDALQELADDKLDLLAISMSPGTGKSTLAIFFICWLSGQDPTKSVLTGSHSNAFVRGAYDECIRVMEPGGEYLFGDVFPFSQISNTNAKDCRIDLGKRKRFETLQFTSIGTGNAGLYRASRLLYCDDLIPGLEVALSKERLQKLWEQYTTDLRQRKIGACKELHIATRWSVHDVIGRLEVEYGDSDRSKFIVIPAMDENDESNFDYPFGVGFSTQFYRDQRDIMDEASWKALYMNQPIEREGLVYDEDELRRYFDLPDTEPDAIISVCDTKDRGEDYACMPVAYVYGQDYFIDDCVFNNGLPEVVDARLVDTLMSNKVHFSQFESNSAGGRVAKDVQEEVKKRGGRTKITTKYTTANKATKILVNSGFVKEHFLFKDKSLYKRNSEYGKMMDALCSYTMAGKNKHDDAPDAMAMLAEYAQNMVGAEIKIFKRPF